jgi:hypothetical protein
MLAKPNISFFMCKVRGQNEHLNFNQNTGRLTFNLSRACFFINRAKNILSPKALQTLYTSFFHTHTFYIAPTYMHAHQRPIPQQYLDSKRKSSAS